MSSTSFGRETRQSAKMKNQNTTIDEFETTSAKKPKLFLKLNKQPETLSSPSKSILNKPKPIDSSLNFDTSLSTLSVAKKTSLEQLGITSERINMDIDLTPNSPSFKGKEKENSLSPSFENFTQRLNFTLIADFSTIPEKLSKFTQIELIDLRCS